MSTLKEQPQEENEADWIEMKNENQEQEDSSSPSSTAQDTTEADATARTKRTQKLKRLARTLLYLSYFLGILWTCLHPVLSILTGEAKCRGWFLDEHSMEIRFVEGKAGQYSLEVPAYLKPKREVASTSLCDNLQNTKHANLMCHKHGDFFEVAMVSPLSNALDATEEGIVVVLPPFQQSLESGSQLHKALLQSLENLADPVATPWLAKAVYVVTPPSDAVVVPLDQTVSSFLDAYSGSRDKTSVVPPLPPKFSTAILRQLIVLDVHDSSTTMQAETAKGNSKLQKLTGKTNLAILPQGTKGVLPNADLVFLVGMLLDRTHFNNARLYPKPSAGTTVLTHGYTQESAQATSAIDQLIKRYDMTLQSHFSKTNVAKLQEWAVDMVNMLFFARTMAFGPTPPHAAALERGIDSLTIQAEFDGVYRRDPSEEMVQYVMEYMVRSLGNLHERLHHSVTLYWLPTPRKFVSHMEYFLPNVLLLLPLAIRAFGLLLPALKAKRNEEDPDSKKHAKQQRIRMTQFVMCVLSAYVLVPIAFCHTALSYIPSLLVTPFVAFPDYASWIR